MTSLDVDDLFTNIPLDKTFDIFIKKVFPNPKTFFKSDFRDLINLAT